MKETKCKCGIEIPIWAKGLKHIRDDVHIRAAQLRTGGYLHRMINGAPQESIFIDIPFEDITEERLKAEGVI